MPRPFLKTRATAVAVTAGIAVALACDGALEQQADALPNAADGGLVSPLVARARRGELMAPSLDDVETMCALLTSCAGLPIPSALVPSDFQACTNKMADAMTSAAAVLFSLTMRECGLTSSSCAGLRTCALHGARGDACRGRGRQGPIGFCDAEGRALTCWHDEVMAVRDCPRGGELCMAESGRAKCTLGTCASDAGDSAGPRCSVSRTHLVQCENGRAVSLDCSAFGLRCATADGMSACATSGPTCSGQTKRCDSRVAVGCFNGHEVRVDCGAAGLSCTGASGATPVGACMAPPPSTGACAVEREPECDGATIKYCYAGSPRTYSCKSLGFRTCEHGKGGVRCAS